LSRLLIDIYLNRILLVNFFVVDVAQVHGSVHCLRWHMPTFMRQCLTGWPNAWVRRGGRS